MSPRANRSGPVLLVAAGAALALIAIVQAWFEGTSRGGTVPDRTPAEILTGAPLPPAPTAATWFTAWSVDVLWLVIALSAAALYALGLIRVRRSGERWPWGRAVCWFAGVALLIWATCGAPAVYADVLVSAHVLGFVLVAAWVPALFAFGAPITLAKQTLGDGGVRASLGRIGRSGVFQVLSHPLFALTLPLALGALYFGAGLIRVGLYAPLLQDIVLVAALAAGWLFALSVTGPDAAPYRFPLGGRLATLAVAVVAHVAFGISLVVSSGLLVAEWFGGLGRTWGATPLEDQALAGVFALVLLLTADLALAVAALRERRMPLARGRAPRQRAGADELAAYEAALREPRG